jgi:hypothetical protein
MTEEEIKKIYHEMLEMFGDKIPNPDHYPRTFEYFVRLYLHSKKHGY